MTSNSTSSDTYNWRYEKNSVRNQFFLPFDERNKEMKARTHRCQQECYHQEKYTKFQAEECSRVCLKPFLKQSEKISAVIKPCELQFGAEVHECQDNYRDPTRCLQGTVHIYQICLREKEHEVSDNFRKGQKMFEEIVKVGKDYFKNEQGVR